MMCMYQVVYTKFFVVDTSVFSFSLAEKGQLSA